ncbi:hypothetical protein [Pilimelia columellifera]|uniref:Uncharacterized protein n=1 Tax=Pilimelia columellifera subsp. columellifera TaxID=706583 RepID=A0ABN3NIR8_9ACTN
MRLLRTILGTLAVVVGLPTLLGGALLITAGGYRDDSGAYAAQVQPVATSGYAVVVPDLDALLGAQASLLRVDRTSVRVSASTRSGPAFVGLTTTAQSEAYLRNVRHARVAEIRLSRGLLPARATDRGGAAVPAAPASPALDKLWLRSGVGGIDINPAAVRGQRLAMVVMSPDATAPGAVRMSVQVRAAWLDPTAWGLTVLGAVLFALGLVLIFWPSRPREIVYVVEPSQVPDIAERLGVALPPAEALRQAVSAPQIPTSRQTRDDARPASPRVGPTIAASQAGDAASGAGADVPPATAPASPVGSPQPAPVARTASTSRANWPTKSGLGGDTGPRQSPTPSTRGGDTGPRQLPTPSADRVASPQPRATKPSTPPAASPGQVGRRPGLTQDRPYAVPVSADDPPLATAALNAVGSGRPAAESGTAEGPRPASSGATSGSAAATSPIPGATATAALVATASAGKPTAVPAPATAPAPSTTAKPAASAIAKPAAPTTAKPAASAIAKPGAVGAAAAAVPVPDTASNASTPKPKPTATSPLAGATSSNSIKAASAATGPDPAVARTVTPSTGPTADSPAASPAPSTASNAKPAPATGSGAAAEASTPIGPARTDATPSVSPKTDAAREPAPTVAAPRRGGGGATERAGAKPSAAPRRPDESAAVTSTPKPAKTVSKTAPKRRSGAGLQADTAAALAAVAEVMGTPKPEPRSRRTAVAGRKSRTSDQASE